MAAKIVLEVSVQDDLGEEATDVIMQALSEAGIVCQVES